MTSVVSSTCRVMGIKALKQDRIGTAMAWGLKSQVRMLEQLTQMCISQYNYINGEGGT